MSWHDSDDEPLDAVDEMNGQRRREQSDDQVDWGDGLEDADSDYWEEVLSGPEDSEIDDQDDDDEINGDNDGIDDPTGTECEAQEHKVLVIFQYRNGSPGISVQNADVSLSEFNHLKPRIVYEGVADTCNAIKRGFGQTRIALSNAGFRGKELCELTDEILHKLIEATNRCQPTTDEERQSSTDQWMYSSLVQLACEISIGNALAGVIKSELRREVVSGGRVVSFATPRKSTYKRFDQAKFKAENPEMYEHYLREVTAYSVKIIPRRAPITVSLSNLTSLLSESHTTNSVLQAESTQAPKVSDNSIAELPYLAGPFQSFTEANEQAKRISREKHVSFRLLRKPEGFVLVRK